MSFASLATGSQPTSNSDCTLTLRSSLAVFLLAPINDLSPPRWRSSKFPAETCVLLPRLPGLQPTLIWSLMRRAELLKIQHCVPLEREHSSSEHLCSWGNINRVRIVWLRVHHLRLDRLHHIASQRWDLIKLPRCSGEVRRQSRVGRVRLMRNGSVCGVECLGARRSHLAMLAWLGLLRRRDRAKLALWTRHPHPLLGLTFLLLKANAL